MTLKKLTIERRDEGNHTLLILKGTIDEDTHFNEVFSNLRPNTFVNLEGIEMINSCGVREWIHAMQKIPSNVKLELEKCTPRIVEQINYVANFLGSGTVNSFLAPYFCPKCKAEENVLLYVKNFEKQPPIKAPTEKCPTCKGRMEFDDIEEEYFSFLQK